MLLLGIYLELAEKYNEILIRWFSANVVDTTLLTQRRPLKKIDLNLEFCDCLYQLEDFIWLIDYISYCDPHEITFTAARMK